MITVVVLNSWTIGQESRINKKNQLSNKQNGYQGFRRTSSIGELYRKHSTGVSKSKVLGSESSAQTAASVSTQYEIMIDGDTDFNTTANEKNWSGDGTPLSPYIIDGIITTGEIIIHNTNVYFQLRNSLFSGGSGIHLYNVTNANISSNTIVNNNYGIYFEFSDNNILYGNKIANNTWEGIYLRKSGNNTIVNNVLENNDLYLSGSQVGEFLQAKVTNNTVNGKALVYWQNISGGTIPSGAGQIILVNCTFVEVYGQRLSNLFYYGLFTVFSTNLYIHNNSIFKCFDGIYLFQSDDNIVSGNTLTNNSNCGISLSFCNNNTVSDNLISNNSMDGIHLWTNSTKNTVSGNTLTNNSNYGIWFWRSSSNVISGNILINNSNYGIFIESDSVDNMIKWNNLIGNNPAGISQAIDNGSSNTFCYNYWSDWTDPDADGIVDDPYSIDGSANNQDFYPLVEPMTASTTTISKSTANWNVLPLLLSLFVILILRQHKNKS